MTEEELQEAIANGKQIECYVYESRDAITWTRSRGPFSPSQRDQEFQNENVRLRNYQETTRRAHPQGIMRSYAFRIECFEAGQAPASFDDDQRRNYRF